MTKHFLVSAALSGMLLLTHAGMLSAQADAGAAADKENPTAYTALRLISKTLGRDALERVVEVTGRDGVPQPFLWKVIIKEGTGSREVDVAGGKITAQRPLERASSSTVPIHLADLNLDSSGAFDAVDVQARKVKLRYDSLNYVLRVGSEGGKPVWTVDLIDKEGSGVGTARLAASDGSVLSTDGRLANNLLPAGTNLPGAVASTTTTMTVRPRSVAEARETPRPTYRPAPPTVREHSTVSTTTVRTTNVPPVTDRTYNTTTTTTTQPDIPVATLSDRDADGEEHTEVTTSTEQGGLFTRAGRTLDHTSHTVEKHLRKAGSTVQRFFTRERSSNSTDGEQDNVRD